MVTESTMAGLKELQALAALAHSEHVFLTAYVNTEKDPVPADLHARLTDLLWQAHERYAGGRFGEASARERERVLPIVPSLKPVGPALVVASSEAAGVLEAYWLPGPVEDHVRVGLGVDALPLIDMLDEFEPVAVAFVENDKARLLLTAAGRVVDAQHFVADVPARERAGGWHAAGYDRHRKELAKKHLKDVASSLHPFHQKHRFERLVVAGPTDPLAVFKGELAPDLAKLVIAETGLDSHASDAQVAAQVEPIAERAEREAEGRIVGDLVVAAEKQQGAVLGVDMTLEALHNHEVHLLVIDPSDEIKGTLCPACDRLLSAAALRCPDCEGPVERVDLREELPRHISTRDVQIEVVHADAASQLRAHGSIGGMLKVRQH